MNNNEYIIENAGDANEVKFSFAGQFKQQTVTWHAHLLTCKHKKLQNQIINEPIRQFIDIKPISKENHYQITVCLNISHITKAEIMKSIIMIRQYKNLALGKHEFGQAE